MQLALAVQILHAVLGERTMQLMKYVWDSTANNYVDSGDVRPITKGKYADLFAKNPAPWGQTDFRYVLIDEKKNELSEFYSDLPNVLSDLGLSADNSENR